MYIYKQATTGLMLRVLIILSASVAVLSYIPSFLPSTLQQTPSGYENAVLYDGISHLISNKLLISKLLSIGFILLVSLGTLQTSPQLQSIKRRSLLSISLVFFFIGISSINHYLSPGIISLFFFFIALTRFLDMLRKKRAQWNAFDSIFYLSFASLFSLSMLWYIPIFIIGFIIIKQINFQNILASLLGLVFPYLIVGQLYYLFGYWEYILYHFEDATEQLLSFAQLTAGAWGYYVIILGCSLFLFFQFLSRYRSLKVRTRTSFLFVYIILFSSLLLGMAYGNTAAEHIPIIALSLGSCLSYYINTERSRTSYALGYITILSLSTNYLLFFVLH